MLTDLEPRKVCTLLTDSSSKRGASWDGTKNMKRIPTSAFEANSCEFVRLDQDILTPLAGKKKLYTYETIGPNVSVSANARVGAGVRLIGCIILDDVDIKGAVAAWEVRWPEIGFLGRLISRRSLGAVRRDRGGSRHLGGPTAWNRLSWKTDLPTLLGCQGRLSWGTDPSSALLGCNPQRWRAGDLVVAVPCFTVKDAKSSICSIASYLRLCFLCFLGDSRIRMRLRRRKVTATSKLVAIAEEEAAQRQRTRLEARVVHCSRRQQ
ncbi:hypothetical protein BHM03_00043411 [Ensete ventricosum]|uniref:Uncharacterized protein n=1 Tax=Ensete ventricosum TaxID=4639 RepID=A0A445MKI1_ENSVE|nr:hypothetical protein BHM03_00043411 [Ensete ventricosum]